MQSIIKAQSRLVSHQKVTTAQKVFFLPWILCKFLRCLVIGKSTSLLCMSYTAEVHYACCRFGLAGCRIWQIMRDCQQFLTSRPLPWLCYWCLGPMPAMPGVLQTSSGCCTSLCRMSKLHAPLAVFCPYCTVQFKVVRTCKEMQHHLHFLSYLTSSGAGGGRHAFCGAIS